MTELKLNLRYNLQTPAETIYNDTVEEFSDYPEIVDIMSKKSFKKFFYDMHKEYSVSDYIVNTMSKKIISYLNTVSYFYHVYRDKFNYDLILKYIDILPLARISFFSQENMYSYISSSKWFYDNVSMDSYLNMLMKHYAKVPHNNLMFSEYEKLNRFHNDIIQMIIAIINKDEELTPIQPMRLHDFHDHVAKVHLKATIKNVNYKQYILHSPVYKDGFTIREPASSHELAEWATQVKNCVYSYENKILEARSSIFLVEKDKKPLYTVEISSPLDPQNRSVQEVERIYRSSPPPKERDKLLKIVNQII